jgi:Tol biopolymer transport system component
MRATRMPVLLLAWLAIAVAPAAAQVQLPAKPQIASLDSDAPAGSPPHWLPGEQWVMQHWLPYDEQRLYSLLGVDRGVIWRQLRDDTRNLAQLAQERGWEPQALARELVAPWRGRLRDPDRLAVLEKRALRTLTQGHLSQHLFFHSLHQEAIPTHATAIFGVASRAEWSTLRRSELSPLQICRLNGLPRGHAQEQAAATLGAYAAKGVARQSIPAVQARRLLSRQLRQLPRWLQQTRYNGPPPIVAPRSSPATASNYSNNAALSGDGREVVFESYQAKLAIAKRLGEIAVMARGVGADAASPPALASGATADPRSNYNPALSANGRWVAFESALGNLNFAKRYGRMEILARDLRSGRTIRVSHPPALQISRSAYNPTISGDGRLIAYEAYDRPDQPGGHTRVVVRDLRSGREHAVPAPPGMADELYEPRLSADGRRLAFSALERATGERSEVFVRDLRSGRTRRVSAPGEEAWEPVLSARGTVVAYTAAGAGGESHVVVRDLARGRATAIASPAGSGLAFEPSLSSSGRRVAFVARPGGTRQTQVFVHDLALRRTQLVSRADGRAGPPGMGSASHPAISGDGRRVAFTSEAWNLSPQKCNSARGIFVRDLARATTRPASAGDGGNRYLGPTKGSSTQSDAFITLLCA